MTPKIARLEKEIADLKEENERLDAIAFGVCVYCEERNQAISDFETRLLKATPLIISKDDLIKLISQTRKEMEV